MATAITFKPIDSFTPQPMPLAGGFDRNAICAIAKKVFVSEISKSVIEAVMLRKTSWMFEYGKGMYEIGPDRADQERVAQYATAILTKINPGQEDFKEMLLQVHTNLWNIVQQAEAFEKSKVATTADPSAGAGAANPTLATWKALVPENLLISEELILEDVNQEIIF